MERGKRVIVLIILIILVICSTGFILINSFMDYEHSHNSSGVITDIITSTDDIKERDHTDMIVRKLAHVIEYALLGFSVACLLTFISHFYRLRFYGYGFFFVLLIAVIDEHIQSFSDRISSTSDIILDFVGAIIGFSFVLIAVFIIGAIMNKKKDNIT